jgi:AcrR family transcriptional regulator
MADTIPNIHSENSPRGRPRTRSDAEVLAAARRVVGERGLARLTIADVAREVGLAPSTLAQRYGSKRALLLAALEPVPDGVAAVFEAAREAHEAPLDALHGALAALSAPVRTHEAYANHLGVLALDVGDPDFRRIAERWFARVLDELRALVVEAVRRNELVAYADPAAVARAVLVAYNGALALWAVTGGGALGDALRGDVEAVLAPWRRRPRTSTAAG